MVCRSCGNTYDYDYFCGENLLKAADKALAHKSFSAAKDMYSFMLDKEPSNVKALRGLILAKNEVVRLFDITPKIKDGTFVIATFNLDKYRTDCDSEASGFFEKTDRILSLYKDYIALKKDLNKLETEADPSDTEDYAGGVELFYYETAETLKKKVVAYSISFVILLAITLLCGLNGTAPFWLMAVLIIAMAVLGILILTALLRMFNSRKDQKNPELSEAEMIKAGTEEKKSELDRVINEINDVFKEMNLME